MTPEQILVALRARYKIVVIITIAATLAALITSLFLPDRYRATAEVVVEVRYADPVAGGYQPGLTQPSYMATQMDIIQSDRVAEGVVKELKLDTNPYYINLWKEKTEGRGSLVSWIAGGLSSKLDVVPAKDSNVVNITCKKNGSAEEAAACANAFAKVYIETTLALRVEPARLYLSYFEAQARSARERLEQVQKALSEYQQSKGIVVVNDDRFDNELTRMNELSSQLSVAQGQQFDTASRSEQAKGNRDSVQEVLQNSLVSDLKSQLAKQEAKLSELRATLGPNHPQVISAQEEATTLRQQLNNQVGLLTRGIATSGRVNAQRVAELQAAIDQQKAKVLKLKQDRDGAAVLQRDVDFAQRAADTVAQRGLQSKLESQVTETNVSVLSPANVPPDPYSPRILLITMIGLVAGAILGAAVVVALEFFNQRVRSVADLASVVGLPVLGLIASDLRLPGDTKRRLPWQAKPPRLGPAQSFGESAS